MAWRGYNGLSTSNDGFCRTPHNDDEPIPWCYTDNPAFRWDKCNVPVCNGKIHNINMVKHWFT